MHAVLAPFFIVTVYDIVYVMSNIVKLAVHSEDKGVFFDFTNQPIRVPFAKYCKYFL